MFESRGPLTIDVRPANASDIPFLWRMLTLAASMPGAPQDVERARGDPELLEYVARFGQRPGDVGVVALSGEERVGAAWARCAPPGTVHPTKVWTDSVPELAVATVPELRGRGVGTRLLEELLQALGGRHASVALTVRAESAAVRLYERLGFAVDRRIVNRVGTTSLVMSKRL